MTTLPPLVCGGCRTCCYDDVVPLSQRDNPANFKTKMINGLRVLAKGKDGNCVYLGKSGCQIYGRQPYTCSNMDCRKYALAVAVLSPEEQDRRRRDPQRRATIQEGWKRLERIGVRLTAAQNERSL